mgnify:CR=1 FL=1
MNTTTDQYWSDYYDKGRDFLAATTAEVDGFLMGLSPSTTQGFATALDIGCGTGQLTRELHHRGFRVVGVDASTSAIVTARRATTAPTATLRYLRRDIERDGIDRALPLAPYNLVTCRYVYAFIKNKRRLLRNVSSVLLPDGAFVLITPLSDRVPPQKRDIAVDLADTRALLAEFFSVTSYERAGDGFFVCRPIRPNDQVGKGA